MKRDILFLSIALVAAVSACTVELMPEEQYEDMSRMVEITATLEDEQTKTSVDESGTVYWTPKDSILVFFGEYAMPFYSYNTRPATKALFVGSVLTMQGLNEIDKEDSQDYSYWGVYPAQTRKYHYRSSNNGDGLFVFVDPVQNAVAGTFDKSTFVTVAKSSDYQKMAFYNLCGGIRFQLASSDVDMVVLSGNNDETLGGEVKVDMDSDGHPFVTEVTNGSKSIRLCAPDGKCFQPGVWYYITALPTTFNNGFTLKIISRANGKMARYTNGNAVAIKRSVFGSLTNLEKDLEFVDYDYSEEGDQISECLEIESIEYTNGKLDVTFRFPNKNFKDLVEKIGGEVTAYGAYNINDEYIAFEADFNISDDYAEYLLNNDEIYALNRLLEKQGRYWYTYKLSNGRTSIVKDDFYGAYTFDKDYSYYIGKSSKGGYWVARDGHIGVLEEDCDGNMSLRTVAEMQINIEEACLTSDGSLVFGGIDNDYDGDGYSAQTVLGHIDPEEVGEAYFLDMRYPHFIFSEDNGLFAISEDDGLMIASMSPKGKCSLFDRSKSGEHILYAPVGNGKLYLILQNEIDYRYSVAEISFNGDGTTMKYLSQTYATGYQNMVYQEIYGGSCVAIIEQGSGEEEDVVLMYLPKDGQVSQSRFSCNAFRGIVNYYNHSYIQYETKSLFYSWASTVHLRPFTKNGTFIFDSANEASIYDSGDLAEKYTVSNAIIQPVSGSYDYVKFSQSGQITIQNIQSDWNLCCWERGESDRSIKNDIGYSVLTHYTTHNYDGGYDFYGNAAVVLVSHNFKTSTDQYTTVLTDKTDDWFFDHHNIFTSGYYFYDTDSVGYPMIVLHQYHYQVGENDLRTVYINCLTGKYTTASGWVLPKGVKPTKVGIGDSMY